MNLQIVLFDPPERVEEYHMSGSTTEVPEVQSNENENEAEKPTNQKQTVRWSTKLRRTPWHFEHFFTVATEEPVMMEEAMKLLDEKQW